MRLYTAWVTEGHVLRGGPRIQSTLKKEEFLQYMLF
jgi:hypothetical protein